MSEQRLIMPKLGQAMEFGTIAEWLAADGAQVKAGQPVLSVESDKATFEIESTADGVIRHLAEVGEDVNVGDPFAVVADTAGAAAEAPTTGGAYALPPQTEPARAPATRAEPAGFSASDRPLASPKARETARRLGVDLPGVSAHRADGLIVAADVEAAATAGRPLASPKARAVAQSLNIDLRAVAAHRPDGLIVAADVEAAAASRKAAPAAATAAPAAEGVPLSRLKRTAADRLARSWAQAPHIVQMVQVDATRLTEALALIKQGALAATLNDLLIKAAADTLAQFPALNARFAGDRLVPFEGVGVGLAVAVEEGLTVPVVHGADRLSLTDIAAQTRELVAAARAGRLTGRQVGGASLTISNLGAYGVSFGTPVLNLDEPVLVFVGAIEQRPVARDGQVVVVPMTTLSIAYDHRVVDGLQAARFSGALKQRLERLEGLLPAEPGAPPLAEPHNEARSAAGALAVAVRGGRHAWIVDEPPAIGGADTGPDPVTYVLGGLVSCMIVAFKLAAQRRTVPIGEVRGELVATPKGKVKTIAIRLEVTSPAPEADVHKLLAPAKATCLVHDMLRPDLPVEVELVVRAV